MTKKKNRLLELCMNCKKNWVDSPIKVQDSVIVVLCSKECIDEYINRLLVGGFNPYDK